jgi:hypothetical protein
VIVHVAALALNDAHSCEVIILGNVVEVVVASRRSLCIFALHVEFGNERAVDVALKRRPLLTLTPWLSDVRERVSESSAKPWLTISLDPHAPSLVVSDTLLPVLGQFFQHGSKFLGFSRPLSRQLFSSVLIAWQYTFRVRVADFSQVVAEHAPQSLLSQKQVSV